jgi:hypothetical protein
LFAWAETLPALLIAGVLFVVLYVVASVSMWIALVAAAAALVVFAFIAAGGRSRRRS